MSLFNALEQDTLLQQSQLSIVERYLHVYRAD